MSMMNTLNAHTRGVRLLNALRDWLLRQQKALQEDLDEGAVIHEGEWIHNSNHSVKARPLVVYRKGRYHAVALKAFGRQATEAEDALPTPFKSPVQALRAAERFARELMTYRYRYLY
ncbi:TPA: hypothetical protein ACIAIE_001992 [Serratia fonticola]